MMQVDFIRDEATDEGMTEVQPNVFEMFMHCLQRQCINIPRVMGGGWWMVGGGRGCSTWSGSRLRTRREL